MSAAKTIRKVVLAIVLAFLGFVLLAFLHVLVKAFGLEAYWSMISVTSSAIMVWMYYLFIRRLFR